MCYRCSVGDFVKTGYNHLKITRELLLTISQNIKDNLTQYCLHIVNPQTTTLNTLVTNNKLLNVNQ